MQISHSLLRSDVVGLCSELGQDRLIVQGAGGNVSYKSDNELWVKASGTWLADAAEKDIFVATDMISLKAAIARDDFGEVPHLISPSRLRPSIETMLHALMPHRIVAHVHAVDALVHLVQPDCAALLSNRLEEFRDWILIDYRKPGAALAAAVAERLKESGPISAVFLRNHGVVVGGETTDDVRALLELLTTRLYSPARQIIVKRREQREQLELGVLPTDYMLLEDEQLEHLVFDEESYSRLLNSWALYPDHVVFLGPQALVYESISAWNARPPSNGGPQYPVFVKGIGIFVPKTFNRAAHEQLRCYYDVVTRLQPTVKTMTLSAADIASLLDWDAEKYRIGNAK